MSDRRATHGLVPLVYLGLLGFLSRRLQVCPPDATEHLENCVPLAFTPVHAMPGKYSTENQLKRATNQQTFREQRLLSPRYTIFCRKARDHKKWPLIHWNTHCPSFNQTYKPLGGNASVVADGFLTYR